jgi:hypothetical protein
MASRGLCSFGDTGFLTEASRLVLEEEPTEPDLAGISVGAIRAAVTLRKAPGSGAELDELDL